MQVLISNVVCQWFYTKGSGIPIFITFLVFSQNLEIMIINFYDKKVQQKQIEF